jgi:hypothetical protein
MSDGEILWLAFALVYLGECCFWVRRGSIAFHLPWDTTAVWRRPATFAGNQQGGVVMANPIPPLGTVLISCGSTLEADAVAARWGLYRKKTLWLRVACTAMWCVVFIGGALLVWVPGMQRLFLPIMAAMAGLMVWINLAFWRAHRILFPERRGERIQHLFTHGIFPPATLRAQDALTRNLLAEFHPAAVAKILCAPTAWRALVQRLLLELRYPIAGESPDASVRYAELARFAGQQGLTIDDLMAPPARAEESCQSYCPRCRTQYNIADGYCSDCRGVVLKPLMRSC